tara:strand:- start:7 stop:495 length:489 start_codon:yes stop_codon:yes gene_type:complete
MERLYTIPLRKEFQKVPNYKKTSKCIKAIRAFAQKHMKCEDVKIGKHLNLEIWKHGRKNPPPRIKVKMVKEKKKEKDQEIEYVIIELPHIKIEKPIVEKKKKEKPKEEVQEVKKDEHKVEEEKEKKEVLKKEVKKVKPKEVAKVKQATPQTKQKVIGRTNKK